MTEKNVTACPPLTLLATEHYLHAEEWSFTPDNSKTEVQKGVLGGKVACYLRDEYWRGIDRT